MFFDKFQSFDHLFVCTFALDLFCTNRGVGVKGDSDNLGSRWYGFYFEKFAAVKKVQYLLFNERKLNQGKNYSEIWPLNCNAVLWLWEPPWSLPIINNYWVKCIKNLKRILLETMKSVKKRVLLSRGTYSICSGVADRNILNPNNINTINYSNF